MYKIFLFLVIIVIFGSCKQDIEKKSEYSSGIDDLDKKYGHLFEEGEDTTSIADDKPRTFASADYSFRFTDIDQDLYKSYKANSKNVALLKTFPSPISHTDSCFYLVTDEFKDTLCDNLNDDFSDEYIDYKYLGFWDSLNYCVFETAIYEELVYFLYDMIDGEQTFLWNVPVLSPERNFIITSSFDLVAGFQPTGLQLLEFKEEKCEKKFELEFESWGPDSCFWINANELVFKRVVLNFEDYSVEKEEYTLMTISKIES
jgi:hypothetical protein